MGTNAEGRKNEGKRKRLRALGSKIKADREIVRRKGQKNRM